jgi:hypothetical protein
MNRRTFLRSLGIGAAAAVAAPVLKRINLTPTVRDGNAMSMLEDLPPYSASSLINPYRVTELERRVDETMMRIAREMIHAHYGIT